MRIWWIQCPDGFLGEGDSPINPLEMRQAVEMVKIMRLLASPGSHFEMTDDGEDVIREVAKHTVLASAHLNFVKVAIEVWGGDPRPPR